MSLLHEEICENTYLLSKYFPVDYHISGTYWHQYTIIFKVSCTFISILNYGGYT